MRRLDVLRAPTARAAVVWLAAWEHAGPNDPPPPEGSDAAKLLKMAPEALRQVARTFCEEEEEVKLQLLGSCGKLYIRTPKAVGLLYKHVLDLCDLDASYDIRDRARLLRALLPPPGEDGAPPAVSPLQAHAAAILFCQKPTPPLPSPAATKGMHSLGTLSQTVQHTAPGYMLLPPHPEVAPPSSTRSAPIRPLGSMGDAPVTGLRIATGAAANRPAGALAGGTDGFFSSSGEGSGARALPLRLNSLAAAPLLCARWRDLLCSAQACVWSRAARLRFGCSPFPFWSPQGATARAAATRRAGAATRARRRTARRTRTRRATPGRVPGAPPPTTTRR